MYVNTHLLGDGVAQSGMPLWELAARVGVSADELVSVDNLQRLPLGVQIRLAEVLDVAAGDLFSGGRRSAQTVEASDASIIGACLGEHPLGFTRDDLARALGWDLDRIERALRRLDLLLSDTGLRLGSHADRILLMGAPGRLDPQTRASLERTCPGDGVVHVDLARVIWSAVFQEEARSRAVPREGIRTAYRRRLLAYESSYAEASEPVAFSLMLSEGQG